MNDVFGVEFAIGVDCALWANEKKKDRRTCRSWLTCSFMIFLIITYLLIALQHLTQQISKIDEKCIKELIKLRNRTCGHIGDDFGVVRAVAHVIEV